MNVFVSGSLAGGTSMAYTHIVRQAPISPNSISLTFTMGCATSNTNGFHCAHSAFALYATVLSGGVVEKQYSVILFIRII